MFASLRARLMWFLIPPLLLIMIGSVVAQYYLSVRRATYVFDRALSDAAAALSQGLEFADGRTRFDLTDESARLLRSDSVDEVYYAVRGPGPGLIAGDEELRDRRPGLVGDEPVIYDDAVGGLKVRVAMVSTECGRERCRIQVAETLNKRRELTDNILIGTVLPQLVVGVLAVALIWYGVGRALSPLAGLSRIINARSPHDLGPIKAESIPSEMRSLIGALNTLFEKLGEADASQKRFISTAAHQLRTPLAGLKAASDLVLLEPRPRDFKQQLEHINQSASRASRLANQLLALARAAPESHRVEPFELANLKRLVEEHVDEWVHMAGAKNIDIGFELRDATVKGNAVLLREMMRNLVHNALEYSPNDAIVTVRCGVADGNPFFEVEDTGPGIPYEYREKAFEPFFRLPGTPGVGSGLGLAIARDVAVAHGANIELGSGSTGRGTLVRVRTDAALQDAKGHPFASRRQLVTAPRA